MGFVNESYIQVESAKVRVWCDFWIRKIEADRTRRVSAAVDLVVESSEKRARSWWGRLFRLKPLNREQALRRLEQEAAWPLVSNYMYLTAYASGTFELAETVRKMALEADSVWLCASDFELLHK